MDKEIASFLETLEKDGSRIMDRFSIADEEVERRDHYDDQITDESAENFDLMKRAMDVIEEKMERDQKLPSNVDIGNFIDIMLDQSVNKSNLSINDTTEWNDSMTSSSTRPSQRTNKRKKKKRKKKRKKKTQSIIQSVLASTPTKKNQSHRKSEIEEIQFPEPEETSKEEFRILKSILTEEPNEIVDKILYFLKVIGNFPNRQTILLESLKRIESIWTKNSRVLQEYSETIAHDLCKKFFINYRQQTEETNELTIRLIGNICPSQLIPHTSQLIHLLKTPSTYSLKQTILNVLFTHGKNGFISIFQECSSSPSSDWDSLMLTILSNHPFSLKYIIVPTLIKACGSPSMNRRLGAVRALYHLGIFGQYALPKLCEMYEEGSVDRRILATTIRRLGPEGERILCSCLSSNWNTRVRATSAYALGQDIPITDTFSDLVVLVHAKPDTGLYFSKRRSPLKFCGDGFLLFDCRELIVQIKRIFDQLNISLSPNKKNKNKNVELDDEEMDEEDEIFDYFYECTPSIEKYVDSMILHISESSNTQGITNLGGLSLDSFSPSKLPDPRKPKLTPTQICMLSHPKKLLLFLDQKSYNSGFFRCLPVPEFHSSSEVIATLNDSLNDPEEKVRLDVARTIGVVSHASSLRYLIARTSDTSNLVKGEIISSMRYLGNSEVRTGPRLTKKVLACFCELLVDKMYNIRYLATKTLRAWSNKFLANSSSKDILSVISILKKSHMDGSINRNAVCKTLCSLGTRGISYLCDVVSKETSYNAKLRMSAAYGLRFIGSDVSQVTIDKVVETLFSCSSDRIRNVRAEVLFTLLVLSKKCATQPYLQNTSLLPFFFTFLSDKDFVVRERAAKCFVEMGDQGRMVLIETLLATKSPDTNEMIRSAAVIGLGLYGPTVFFEPFMKALRRERSVAVKRQIKICLEEVGWKPVLKWVFEKESKAHAKKILERINRVLEVVEDIPLFYTLKRKIVEKL